METDASGKGLGAVLSQKQSDGRYHPIAYASRIMTETEQRYHSNKQEFLALKWAVTEQFHEYLSPYGKNRNEFVVQTDNNPLTYIFSSANLCKQLFLLFNLLFAFCCVVRVVVRGVRWFWGMVVRGFARRDLC